MQTVSMRLPDDLLLELDRAAKARRVPKSRIVRESLEKTLRAPSKKKPSCLDLASDLVGSLKGLPKDIATNPKYMEGFGE
jgi:hypothetical protein